MHDRAAWPTGAVKSAAAIAVEIMILLNIDLRIARVRPGVEENRSKPSCSYLVFLLPFAIEDYDYYYENDVVRRLLFATGLW